MAAVGVPLDPFPGPQVEQKEVAAVAAAWEEQLSDVLEAVRIGLQGLEPKLAEEPPPGLSPLQAQQTQQ